MVAQLHKLYPMPRRSHHHQIDEDANVKVYDLRWTDDELRQMWKSDDSSPTSGNLALDMPTRSNAGHSDDAGYGKPRILQLSNAPVMTMPVYPPMLNIERLVNTRNGRKGEIQRRLFTGSGVKFLVIIENVVVPTWEYYTPEQLRALNPGMPGLL